MASLKTLQSAGGSAGPSAAEVQALGPWFHNLHLPDGTQTAPDHPLGDYPAFKWPPLAAWLPADLGGCHALDIGCNAGFFAFELARRGARVIAMDHDPRYLRQARWAAERLGLADRISLRQGDVYDLADERDCYDLVLFLGVFYHLRHPLLGLELAAAASRQWLLVQSLCLPPTPPVVTDDPGYLGLQRLQQPGWPAMAFVESELAGDPSNWWVPNTAALPAMVRSCGFEPAETVAGDILCCQRRGPTPELPAGLRLPPG